MTPLPMPRAGTLMTRRRLTSSCGFSTQLEVREGVLDFLALVEPDAADDLVGGAGAPQRVFERSRLRVGAIQDRDRVLDVVVERVRARARDELGLVEVVAGAVVAGPSRRPCRSV